MCVPFAVLVSVLYTLTALSPTISLFRKPGRRIIGRRCVGSLCAFIAVLIFVYKGGGSFMAVGILDSLDFPWIFQKASHLITYNCRRLSQFKQSGNCPDLVKASLLSLFNGGFSLLLPVPRNRCPYHQPWQFLGLKSIILASVFRSHQTFFRSTFHRTQKPAADTL